MSPEARAVIRWVPASRGGRQQPPSAAAGYATIARFESDPTWSLGTWSVQIVDARELRGTEVLDARVRFLVPEAPDGLLKEGERFELLEGRKVVAKGVVLPDSLQSPPTVSEFEMALLG